MSTKICLRCKEAKPLTGLSAAFTRDKTRKDGYAYYCRQCKKELHDTYHAKHPEKRSQYNKARKPRDVMEKRHSGFKSRLKRYGLTEEEYEDRVQRQHKLCMICGKPETAKYAGKPKRLAVDHNHHTGKVRDLLCYRCNSVIGYAHEDSAILRTAALYLERHAE